MRRSRGRYVRGGILSYLEHGFVHLKEGNGLASAHPAARTEGELDVTLHLHTRRLVGLEEPLWPEYLCIFAEQGLRPHKGAQVRPNCCPAGEEVTMYRIATGWHLFAEGRGGWWAYAQAFVYDGLYVVRIAGRVMIRTPGFRNGHKSVTLLFENQGKGDNKRRTCRYGNFLASAPVMGFDARPLSIADLISVLSLWYAEGVAVR